MGFRIADTFTDSLAKLTGREQKAVKTTAFGFADEFSNPACSRIWVLNIDEKDDFYFSPKTWSNILNKLVVTIFSTENMFIRYRIRKKSRSWNLG